MSAHSNVNFDLLTETEQIERYRNLREEYFTLTKRINLKKLQKYHHQTQSEARNRTYPFSLNIQQLNLKRASEIVEKGKYELEDCGSLIQNLVKLIASKKLTGRMVEMEMICDLVGRCLDHSEEEDEGDNEPGMVRKFFEKKSKEEVIEFFSGVKPDSNALKNRRIQKRKGSGGA